MTPQVKAQEEVLSADNGRKRKIEFSTVDERMSEMFDIENEHPREVFKRP